MPLNILSAQSSHSLRRRMVLAIGAVLLILGFSALKVGYGLEEAWQSARDTMQQRSASGEVVVIEIDAASIEAFKRWPWPRSRYADLLDALAPARPEMVAFDIDFSAPSTPKEDGTFARAIDAFPATVILPTFKQTAGSLDHNFIESLPVSSLRDSAFLASVNVQPDPDGVMRKYSYGMRTAHVIRPSMGALLAGATGTIDESFRIDQSINPATIPRVSFASIINGTADIAKLSGKKLFVGATAIELGDRYAVPRNGVLPGVIIQAQAADTLSLGRALPDLGRWPAALAAIAAVVGAAFLKRRSHRLILIAGMIAALNAGLIPCEMSGLGTFQTMSATLALMIAFVVIVLIGLNEAIFNKERLDVFSGLRNGLALVEGMDPSQQYRIVTARFRELSEIIAMLGSEERANLKKQLIERILVGAGTNEIFSAGADAFVWKHMIEESPEAVGEQLDGLRHLIASPMLVGAHSLRLKPHFGVAQGVGQDGMDLLARSMGAANTPSNGRAWTLDNVQLARSVRERQSLIGAFPNALAENQFWIAYQPQLHLANGAISSAEALVRWRHPQLGEIMPGLFIPVFEQEELIHALTLYVFESVLGDVARWVGAGTPIRVAVNVSGGLLANAAFNNALLRRCDTAGDLVRWVTLEVTETAALSNAENAIAALNAYRACGFEVSIDDYGTGQSTLSYLRNFPASEIKIDQSFVRDIATSNHDQLLVRSTIGLAHELGFSVVAEGVEDEKCLAVLQEMGCDVLQGWHIGRPISADEFEQRHLASRAGGNPTGDRLFA